jgi:hypothetical protein
MEKVSKEFGMTFERGTDIGFHMDEIKQNTTEDLLVLRHSIYGYLKTKKLKKRNSKYMDVYIRINKELSLRNAENISREIPKKEEEPIEENKTNSFSAQKLFEFFETQKLKEEEEKLLNKKTKNSTSFDIPNFLNDKTNEVIKKKKEIIKQKDDKIICKEIKDLKENSNNSCLNNNYSGNLLIFLLNIKINFLY